MKPGRCGTHALTGEISLDQKSFFAHANYVGVRARGVPDGSASSILREFIRRRRREIAALQGLEDLLQGPHVIDSGFDPPRLFEGVWGPSVGATSPPQIQVNPLR